MKMNREQFLMALRVLDPFQTDLTENEVMAQGFARMCVLMNNPVAEMFSVAVEG